MSYHYHYHWVRRLFYVAFFNFLVIGQPASNFNSTGNGNSAEIQSSALSNTLSGIFSTVIPSFTVHFLSSTIVLAKAADIAFQFLSEQWDKYWGIVVDFASEIWDTVAGHVWWFLQKVWDIIVTYTLESFIVVVIVLVWGCCFNIYVCGRAVRKRKEKEARKLVDILVEAAELETEQSWISCEDLESGDYEYETLEEEEEDGEEDSWEESEEHDEPEGSAIISKSNLVAKPRGNKGHVASGIHSAKMVW